MKRVFLLKAFVLLSCLFCIPIGLRADEVTLTAVWPFTTGPANETSATVSHDNIFSATSF